MRTMVHAGLREAEPIVPSTQSGLHLLREISRHDPVTDLDS